jgi:hypothetical protein
MEEFDFDSMYKLVSEDYKTTKEKCLVCHFAIDSKEVELNCKHQYHFNCFDINKNNKCFYCGIKVKGIKIKIDNNLCNQLVKTGPKKGQVCGRNKCHYHK